MNKHFDHLKYYLPDISSYRILDIGSGKGKFIISAAKAGAGVVGLEPYRPYIEKTFEQAKAVGVDVEVVHGQGESIPFPDQSFDFINLSEVLEHVESPDMVMREGFRVLKKGAYGYVSVPNRFSMKDQHFHLWFVNWLPRTWGEKYISFKGRHKDYSIDNGRQRLSEMHYYTYPGVKRFLESMGFEVCDQRIIKIRKKRWALPMELMYLFLRWFYFDSFHILIRKP